MLVKMSENGARWVSFLAGMCGWTLLVFWDGLKFAQIRYSTLKLKVMYPKSHLEFHDSRARFMLTSTFKISICLIVSFIKKVH